jgi:hypothetical protein
MIATRDLKNTPRIREDAPLDVFHPGSVDAHGNFIFGFARNCAGVASDALAIIDYEAVFHFVGISPRENRLTIIRGPCSNGDDSVEPLSPLMQNAR